MQYIENGHNGHPLQNGAVENVPTQTIYPLAQPQWGIWLGYQNRPQGREYNMAYPLRIRTHLVVPQLVQALQCLVNRHAILRTTVAMLNGKPVQQVAAQQTVAFTQVQGTRWSYNEMQQWAQQTTEAPYDLEQGPLFRVALLTCAPDDHLLLLQSHHILLDMMSWWILLEELGTLYTALQNGDAPDLPVIEKPYHTFAAEHNAKLAKQEERLWRYWEKQLAGELPLLTLPTDRPRPAVRRFHGATTTFSFPDALTSQLRALTAAQGSTLYMTLLAAYQVLLTRLAGQTEIVVGAPVAARTEHSLRRTVGLFADLIPLRADLTGNPPFTQFLRQVSQTVFQGLLHQHYPFYKVVEKLKGKGGAHQGTLFQTIFQLERPNHDGFAEMLAGPVAHQTEWGGLLVETFPVRQQEGRTDMTLIMYDNGQSLFGTIFYDADLFDLSTMQRLIGHFQTLLAGICANPEQGVADLPLLTAAERRQLLVDWASTGSASAAASETCIHQLFEAQAARTPHVVAVTCEDRSLTYGELNARANQLAHHLQSLGVGPDSRVGICVERSLAMIVGLLGILKAGGAYVPLDPTYPTDRLAFMLEDAAPPVLLTQESLISQLPPSAAHIVCLDRDWQQIATQCQTNPQCAVQADNLAYIIYTSGSTGRPKGAMLMHRNVVRLFTATEPWFHFNSQDVWSLFHSFAFDFSVWEIWGALLYGGRLLVVPYLVSRSPDDFYALLVAEGVTVLNQTPSAFRQLIHAEERAGVNPKLKLRYVVFGGEALELASLQPWFARHGDQQPQLINMYGITETTVHVTYRPLTQADLAQSGSLIGGPIPDLQLYILDAQQQPVPIGVAGELYVGGAGVARGYLNRPELTDARFIPNPLFATDQLPQRSGRLYRTGDLARRLANGDIEYLGRIDQQVKIRGFRIELGEIETVLMHHPAVREAVVMAREDAPGEKQLVAYVVPGKETGRQGDKETNLTEAGDHGTNGFSPSLPVPELAEGLPLSLSDLRRHLQSTLPDYMVPSAFVQLTALPLTANGKIDRKALPVPSTTVDPLNDAYVAPRDNLEQKLAAIWQGVLTRDRVGIHDDFFALGGHSLVAVTLVNALQNELQAIVHIAALFEAPTIAQLADYLRQHYPAAISALEKQPAKGEPATEEPRVGQPARVNGYHNGTSAAKSPTNGTVRQHNGHNKIQQLDANAVAQVRDAFALPPLPISHCHPKNKPALFLLSAPRTGSTLLRVILAGHSRLFAPPELGLLGFQTLADRRAFFAKGDASLLDGPIYALRELEKLDVATARAQMEQFEAQQLSIPHFYAELQHRLGARTLVDKTPNYAFDLSVLRDAESIFAGNRYLFLVRHPYAMIRSFEEARIDLLWPQAIREQLAYSRLQLAELIWLLSYQNLQTFANEIPAERRHWVRYEDLVKQPEATIREICNFLQIEFQPAMMQPYQERQQRMTAGLTADARMLGDLKFHQHTTIDGAVADSWRQHYDTDFLSDLTWQVAQSFGYAPIQSTPNPQRLDTIQRMSQIAARPTPIQTEHFSDQEVATQLQALLAKRATQMRS